MYRREPSDGKTYKTEPPQAWVRRTCANALSRALRCAGKHVRVDFVGHIAPGVIDQAKRAGPKKRHQSRINQFPFASKHLSKRHLVNHNTMPPMCCSHRSRAAPSRAADWQTRKTVYATDTFCRSLNAISAIFLIFFLKPVFCYIHSFLACRTWAPVNRASPQASELAHAGNI